MKLVDTIKAFIAKVSEYFTAAKDISKKISDTLNSKEEVEEDEDDDEEEEKPKAKKKKSVKKKK